MLTSEQLDEMVLDVDAEKNVKLYDVLALIAQARLAIRYREALEEIIAKDGPELCATNHAEIARAALAEGK